MADDLSPHVNCFPDTALPSAGQLPTEAPQPSAAEVGQDMTTRRQDWRICNDAFRQSGEIVQEAVRHNSENGVDAARLADDQTRRMRQSTHAAEGEGQREFFPVAAKWFEEISRKLANAEQSASSDECTLMTPPALTEDSLRDLQHSLAGLVESVVRTNLRTTQELFRLTSPGEIAELQQRFVRDYTAVLMQGSIQLIQLIHQTTDQLLPRREQLHEKRQQAHKIAAGQLLAGSARKPAGGGDSKLATHFTIPQLI